MEQAHLQNNATIQNVKLGFIGGGNMAQAIISGLLNNGFTAHQIMVSDPVEEVRTLLGKKGIQTTTDNNAIISFCDTLVLAIKPQLFQSVLQPLADKFHQHLIISIAAGITIASIQELLHHTNIVRAMPNTPALVGQGATGVFAPNHIAATDKAIAIAILQATGLVIDVDHEEKLHAVTAVSGSAPAYFFYMMEAMIQKGTELGLTPKQATQLTLQTAVGASQMARESTESPTILRNKVTSPNGTTHAAIENMKNNNLDKTIMDAMQACVTRSIEMSQTI